MATPRIIPTKDLPYLRLLPKDGSPWDFDRRENWNPEWTGKIEIKDIAHRSGGMGLAKAWIPYVLVALLLVL